MPQADWPAWQSHLKQRATPQPFASLWPKLTASPLRWALESLVPDAHLVALLGTLDRFDRPQTSSAVIAELTLWRATLSDGPPRWQLGIGALAWAQALPALAQLLSAESWQGLLDDLVRLAIDAAALQPIDDPLTHQLLAVELPLTLAYLFPELADCAALVPQAKKLWSWGAEEATDGEGLLPARHLSQTKALLASWTRALTIVKTLGEASVHEDVQVQYEWLLRQTLRLMRNGASLCFTPLRDEDDTEEIVKAALAHSNDPEDRALCKVAFEGAREVSAAKKPKKQKSKKPLPEPFLHSEWSNAALLRGSWLRGAPRLAVAYDRQPLQCELFSHGHVLLSGSWRTEVTIDGWTWHPEHAWEEVCWHTDDDVVYLELETRLTDGWKLQRQMMLATHEQVLFVADAVLGKQPAQIGYRSVLPLDSSIRFLPADETREGYLIRKKAQALVLPLALPEWRTEVGHGELKQVAEGLELTQNQHGMRMCAPLWIDLQTDRLRKPCTWRQLTVAEQLQIQPRDVAVAFRAQVGKEQFAIYRSMARKANRTFLGQNVVNEFFAARFKSDGTTEALLEIE